MEALTSNPRRRPPLERVRRSAPPPKNTPSLREISIDQTPTCGKARGPLAKCIRPCPSARTRARAHLRALAAFPRSCQAVFRASCLGSKILCARFSTLKNTYSALMCFSYLSRARTSVLGASDFERPGGRATPCLKMLFSSQKSRLRREVLATPGGGRQRTRRNGATNRLEATHCKSSRNSLQTSYNLNAHDSP